MNNIKQLHSNAIPPKYKKSKVVETRAEKRNRQAQNYVNKLYWKETMKLIGFGI